MSKDRDRLGGPLMLHPYFKGRRFIPRPEDEVIVQNRLAVLEKGRSYYGFYIDANVEIRDSQHCRVRNVRYPSSKDVEILPTLVVGSEPTWWTMKIEEARQVQQSILKEYRVFLREQIDLVDRMLQPYE